MRMVLFLVVLVLLCGCVDEEYHVQVNIPVEDTGDASLSATSVAPATTFTLQSTSTTTSLSTTTTFKLKHQGNFSSNKMTTTTTGTTVPIRPDWMASCVEDKECIIHYGCCPCSNPTALNKVNEKSWDTMLHCPISVKCGGGLKPCWYKAYCVNKTCERRLE